MKHLALLLAPLALAACGPSGAATQLAGTWLQTTSEERVGTAPWAVADDVACRADNTEEYADDGSWTLYDGTNQCGAGTGIVEGTWRLAAGDTKVIYTYDKYDGEYEATIETLTATELVLTKSTGDVVGTQVRSTYRKR